MYRKRYIFQILYSLSMKSFSVGLQATGTDNGFIKVAAKILRSINKI